MLLPLKHLCCSMNISISPPGTVWEPAGIWAGLYHHFANRHTQVWKFCFHPREMTSGKSHGKLMLLYPWVMVYYSLLGFGFKVFFERPARSAFYPPSTRPPPIPTEGHSWTCSGACVFFVLSTEDIAEPGPCNLLSSICFWQMSI